MITTCKIAASKAVAAALIGLTFCSVGLADSFTYTYTGNPFTEASGLLSTTDFITVTLTFPQPLPANLVNVNLLPIFQSSIPGVSWSMSDGSDTLSSSNPEDNLFYAEFFNTDSSGVITVWNVMSDYSSANNSLSMQTTTAEGFDEDYAGSAEVVPVYFLGQLISYETIATASGSNGDVFGGGGGPGTWTMTETSTSTPEPSTWAMLFLPMTVVVCLKKFRSCPAR